MKKCLLFSILLVVLAACGSNLPEVPPPPTACSDGGAAKLGYGIKHYNDGELELAFESLQASATCGNSDAQVNLGYMYARGDVSAPDQAEAMRLYELSAAQGNGEGMNAIGYKYLFGTGVSADIKTAIHWYCKAIAHGNVRAINNLATLYDEGNGVPKDEMLARSLYKYAADNGHINSLRNLARSYKMSANKEDQEKGEALEMQAAMAGSAGSQSALREAGYKGDFPPAIDEFRTMKVQKVLPPATHIPVCDQPANQ